MELVHPPIIALSSGTPPSGVALIRLSGESVIDLSLKCLDLKKSSSEIIPRHMYYCNFIDPGSLEILDDVEVCFYKAPNSYTAEDSVELFCHGGRYIIDKIISTYLEVSTKDTSSPDLRLAQRGEFTKRAYLNGRINLVQAESVLGVIEANSYESWVCSCATSRSRLVESINSLRSDLIEASSLLEARIDFPEEEDVCDLSKDVLIDKLKGIKSKLAHLCSTFKFAQMLKNGLQVSLIGEPNSGKSTLTNTLVGSDRCIVSSIPGTTRDYIEASCLIEGKLIHLIDTAGLRSSTSDPIEQIGIEKSWARVLESDLVLCLLSCDSEDSDYMKESIQKLKSENKDFILLKTKSDLLDQSDNELKDYLYISCKTNQGIDELKKRIGSYIDQQLLHIKDRSFVSSLRQKQALIEAQSYIDLFFKDLDSSSYDECLALDLQLATKSLESIIGNVENSEILNKIFDSFCIGK